MEAPIGGSRRSKLTLAGSLQPTEAINFNQMRRVREPVKVWCARQGRRRVVSRWSDPSGRKGRVLGLLENVDLPSSL